MSCRAAWYIEKQVLHLHFWGDLGPQDYEDYFRLCYNAYDESDAAQVHVLVDASHITNLPNLIDVQRSLPQSSHPRAGWTVTVKDGPINVMARFVTTMVGKALNVHFRHFDTLDEALEFLRHIAPDLAWNQARQDVLKLDSSITG